MKKKAISEILSNTLLILVVIVIGALIFLFSSSFINTSKVSNNPNYNAQIVYAEVVPPESGEFSTGPVEGSIELTEIIRIGVERQDNEGNVTGVLFIFEDNKGSSYSFEVYDGPNDAGMIKTYNISNVDIGIENFDNIKKIKVSLIVGKSKTKTLSESDNILNA